MHKILHCSIDTLGSESHVKVKRRIKKTRLDVKALEKKIMSSESTGIFFKASHAVRKCGT